MPSSCGENLQGAVFRVAEAVLELRHPAAIARLIADEILPDQAVERLLHRRFIQIQHRVAIALLVAGIGQRVERQADTAPAW